jgi:hypothetical protein
VDAIINWCRPRFATATVNGKIQTIRHFNHKSSPEKMSFSDYWLKYKGNKAMCPGNTIDQASELKIAQLSKQRDDAKLEYRYQQDRLTLAEANLKVLTGLLPDSEQRLGLSEMEALERGWEAQDNRYDDAAQAHAGAELSTQTADDVTEAAINNSLR